MLGKALKKAPGERYQALAAFAEDLRRYLAAVLSPILGVSGPVIRPAMSRDRHAFAGA